MKRVSVWLVAILAGCGGGSSAVAPFATPRIATGHPLIAEVAECRGNELAVRECVVEEVCAYAFDPVEPLRFHIHPVGATPWVQITLNARHEVSDIELARSGPDGTSYEVGFVCEEAAAARAEAAAEEAEEAEEASPSPASGDLLTLAAEQRTHAAARAAFSAAEEGELVFQHALWLARSSEAADHAVLREALASREVVELLGNTTIDRGPRMRLEPLGHRWPLAQILFALRDGNSASARSLLLELVELPLWADDSLDVSDGHVEWLVRALASVRPLPGAALAYLREQARPDAHAGVVASTLVANGSEEAVSALRALSRDRRLPMDDKEAWLRADIAASRDRAEVLQVGEALLAAGLPPRLERRLLEDLFGDFSDQIRPDTQLRCPALEGIPEEAEDVLRRIAAGALARPIAPSTRRVIEDGLRQLDGGEDPPP